MTLNLLANQEYKLKLTVDGTWETVKGYSNLTKTAEGLSYDTDNNIVFTLAEAGAVTVIYNDTTFKLEGNFKVNIVYGIFLVGSFNDWQFLDNYRFSINPANEAEYIITKTLTVGDELKVVKVVNDVETWYPAEGSNYVVDAAHAGEKTIYFRTTYNEEWSAFGGYIWIDANSGTGIDDVDADAKAVKVLRDGMIFIIRGDKTYNAQGMLVK